MVNNLFKIPTAAGLLELAGTVLSMNALMVVILSWLLPLPALHAPLVLTIPTLVNMMSLLVFHAALVLTALLDQPIKLSLILTSTISTVTSLVSLLKLKSV